MKVKETNKQLIKMKSELLDKKMDIDMELLNIRSKQLIIANDVFEKKMGEILLKFGKDSMKYDCSLFFNRNTFEELLKLHRQSHDDMRDELIKQNGGK
jgi:hypothetical protein